MNLIKAIITIMGAISLISTMVTTISRMGAITFGLTPIKQEICKHLITPCIHLSLLAKSSIDILSRNKPYCNIVS